MKALPLEERERLLADYWTAQAQFGPFDIGPEEYLRKCAVESGSEEKTLP